MHDPSRPVAGVAFAAVLLGLGCNAEAADEGKGSTSGTVTSAETSGPGTQGEATGTDLDTGPSGTTDEADTGASEDSSTTGGPPVVGDAELLFSDLVRGPPEVFVWLYGWELPSDPAVTVDGVPCPVIVDTEQWVPANGKNPELRRVAVQVPSGGEISIAGAEGTLEFTETQGAIVEASPPGGVDGDDYDTDDVVYLREGTYASPAPGHDRIIERGDTEGLVIAGYPGEAATIQITEFQGFDAGTSTAGNFVLSNLAFVGDLTQSGGTFERGGHNPNGARVVGNTCTGANSTSGSAFMNIGRVSNMYVLANVLTDNGANDASGHEIYHGGWVAQSNVHVSYNWSTGYTDRIAIEVYGHSDGESLSGLRIEHNFIDRQSKGSGTHYGIQVGGTDAPVGLCNNNPWIVDAVIHSNTVQDSTDHAFRLRDEGCDYVVTDNVTINATSDIDIQCVGSLKESGNSWQ